MNLRIKLEGRTGEIYLDDIKLKKVAAIRIDANPDNLPQAVITLMPERIDLDISGGEVYFAKEILGDTKTIDV